MGRKFEKIPAKTFDQLVLGAGIILDSFDTKSGVYADENILFASSGGYNFSDTPTFRDAGADIDNCPKETKELLEIESRAVKLTGAAVTATEAGLKMLMAAADVLEGKLTPRDVLKLEDFKELWWVGNYGKKDGGLLAIHMMNTLNRDGFQFQTTDKDKTKFNFGFMAHYSLNAQDTVPYEVYLSAAPVV